MYPTVTHFAVCLFEYLLSCGSMNPHVPLCVCMSISCHTVQGILWSRYVCVLVSFVMRLS